MSTSESGSVLGGGITAVEVVGDSVYAFGGLDVSVYDIVDQSNVQLSSVQSPFPAPVEAVARGEAAAVFACGRAIAFAPVDAWPIMNAGDLTILEVPGMARDATVSGNVAYVAAYDAGVHVLRMDDRSLLNSLNIADRAYSVHAADNLLFVGADDWFGGVLHVFDIATLETPQLVTSVRTNGIVQALASDDEFAFFGTTAGVIHAVRKADVANVIELSTLSLGGVISDLVLLQDEPNRLFAFAEDGEYWEVDIRMPFVPTIGWHSTANWHRPSVVAVQDSAVLESLYVADAAGSVYHVNVSESRAPAAVLEVSSGLPGSSDVVEVQEAESILAASHGGLIQRVSIQQDGGSASGLHVNKLRVADLAPADMVTWNDHIIFADSEQGVVVVPNLSDVTDGDAEPGRDAVVVPVNGRALGLFLDGDHLFVATGMGGVETYRLESEGAAVSLTLLAQLHVSGIAEAVFVEDDTAYIASRFSGLHVIDVADLAAPARVTTIHVPGNAMAVSRVDDSVLVGSRFKGVYEIEHVGTSSSGANVIFAPDSAITAMGFGEASLVLATSNREVFKFPAITDLDTFEQTMFSDVVVDVMVADRQVVFAMDYLGPLVVPFRLPGMAALYLPYLHRE